MHNAHKAPRMKIVLPPQTFQEHLEKAKERAEHAKHHTDIMQDALNKAKKTQHEFDQAVTRLSRIEWLTKCYASVNVMDWRALEPGGLDVNIESRRTEGLETSMLDALVTIDRRIDMKKLKYHVQIRVWKRLLSEHTYKHGGFIDYDYGMNKYGKDTMDCKFATLAQADKYVEVWQETFYHDHLHEINFDRAMRESLMAE